MGKKLTNEEFIQRIKNVNPNIEIMETYINSHTKILCRCKIDNYEWRSLPIHLLRGHGCPKCAKRPKKNTEYFISEMKIKNPNIQILGEYINDSIKILCKCLIDEYEWSATPSSLLQKHGCPKCAKNIKNTTENFKLKMLDINPNINILGEYKNINTKILCQCDICKRIFSIRPSDLLHGQGCSHCNRSKGENKISDFLNQHNISFVPQNKFYDCISKRKLPFDFYLPDYNMCIEYDGKQHFEAVCFGGISKEQSDENLIICQKHDEIKTQYCKDNKIKLLRIPYWEFNNIENILENELLKGGGCDE